MPCRCVSGRGRRGSAVEVFRPQRMPVSLSMFSADGEGLVAKARISGDGRYRVAFAPGTYVVDIARNGMDRADGLPKAIVIENRKTVQLSMDIVTGIR